MPRKLSPIRWAQERNFAKMRLSAALATCQVLAKSSILTSDEKVHIRNAASNLCLILSHYKQSNEASKFLNT